MDPFSTLSGKQRDLIQALAVAHVDYVVIGGYAMRFHGLERPAKKIWISWLATIPRMQTSYLVY
jgi:hypothetical protein